MQRHSGPLSKWAERSMHQENAIQILPKLLAIRRALKGPKLKSLWSSRRLGLSGPSLTVVTAPHKTAGTRPKWARASKGTRPKWARACIFSNLFQFCFSKSLQGGGRDARKAFAARAPNKRADARHEELAQLLSVGNVRNLCRRLRTASANSAAPTPCGAGRSKGIPAPPKPAHYRW